MEAVVCATSHEQVAETACGSRASDEPVVIVRNEIAPESPGRSCDTTHRMYSGYGVPLDGSPAFQTVRSVDHAAVVTAPPKIVAEYDVPTYVRLSRPSARVAIVSAYAVWLPDPLNAIRQSCCSPDEAYIASGTRAVSVTRGEQLAVSPVAIGDRADSTLCESKARTVYRYETPGSAVKSLKTVAVAPMTT